LASVLASVMPMSETVYLQIEERLLPEDATRRLGYAVDPHVYFGDVFDRLWEEVRPRMNDEFAVYVEHQFGGTPYIIST
jgi:hypothetical protein